MNQKILDRAVKLATRSALDGSPIKRIIWVPSPTASSDPDGSFLIERAEMLSASQAPPWE